MHYGLYLSAEGAYVQAKRLEVIANNLANVDTAGFRRQLAVFQARQAEAISRGIETPGTGSVQDLGGGVRLQQTKLELAPGKLKQTGVPTDLAIDGAGFFVVEKDGNQFLTRAGNFAISQLGQLVAQVAGGKYPVLSQAGTPIFVDPTLGPWEVLPWGAIRQAGMILPLALVEPTSPDELEPAGGNLFRPLGDLQPIPPAQRRVVAGFLEVSAVEPTLEMMELIETARAIEANLNMMQTQDSTLAALVTRVLRPLA